MKRKRVSAGIMAAVLVTMSVAACGSSGKNAKDPSKKGHSKGDTIKVGCVFPVSGNNADQGVFNVDGCKFAVDYVNSHGGIKALGGKNLELVTYDNMSEADQSKAAAERLINENPDIAAVTGAGASSFVLPMLPVFEKNKMPFLTAQISESITNQGYQYTFRFGSTGGSFSEYQVKFLEWLNKKYNLGITKVGIVYEDTEYGISNTKGAVEAIKESAENDSGLKIVYDQSFTAGSSDLTNIVVGLKDSGCQVVFPTCYTQDAKLMFNTMKTMKYSPLIIGGGGGFLYPSFGEELGSLVNGVVSVTGHNYDIKTITQNPEIADIGAQFEKKYGYFMPEQAASAFSAIYLMSQALEKAGSTDHEKVARAMRELTCKSATPGGAVKFDKTGANVSAFAVVVQWQKGDDGVYRTRCVFPEEEAGAKFQLPEDLKAMQK